MNLPALYYSGRNNPPHFEIWINYFLRMLVLYSNKVYEISKLSNNDDVFYSLSYLKTREKELREEYKDIDALSIVSFSL